MKTGAYRTRDDLIKLQFALPADEWIIQTAPEGDHERPIRDIISKRKLWSIEQVLWFRARNVNGCHIYGRPFSTRFVLIDDVKHEGITRLKHDGLTPTAVVETSPDNFQVWITVSGDELAVPVATQLAKLLEREYSTENGSADAYHLGRLPGLRNKKPKYQKYDGDGGPLVLLRSARTNPVVPDAIIEWLDKAYQLAERIPHSSSSAFGRCGPITDLDIDPSRSPLTREEAKAIYAAELEYQISRSDGQITGDDRSKADNAVVYGLRNRHWYEPDDLAALLVFASDKAQERGFKYVERTVRAACSSA